MPNRIDRNASSGDRLRRTIQRLSQGAASSTLLNKINVIAPITGGGSLKNNPSIGLQLFGLNPGLGVFGGGLAIGHDASLSASGSTLSVNYNPNSLFIDGFLGLEVKLNSTGPLISTASGLSETQASSTANGYLSSTDWITFNGKGSGGSTSIIAADASILIGSSTGSTTIAVQEHSGRGISTDGGGIGVLLADQAAGGTTLVSQDFTTLSAGTQVGTIGGAGTTWKPYYDGGTNALPGGTQSNAYITVNGASAPRAAGWESTPFTGLISCLYVPTIAGLGTAYTVSMVAEPAGTSTGGAGLWNTVGLFVRGKTSGPDGTGVGFQFFTDKMNVVIGAGSSTGPSVSYGSTLTGFNNFAVSVNGDLMSAIVNGTTVATYTISNYSSQTGVGFIVGGSANAPSTGGVQSWKAGGGAAVYSGLTLTPPNLSVLLPSTGILFLDQNGIEVTQASSTANGYLSSTDWMTFNGKAPFGLIYSNTTDSATLTNVTTTQAFNLTYTIPANSLVAGKRLRISAQGYVNTAGASGTQNITVQGTIGNLSRTTPAVAVVTGANFFFFIEMDFICRVSGAAGTADMSMLTTLMQDGQTNGVNIPQSLGATSFDTTASHSVQIQVTSSLGTNTFVLRELYIETLN